MSENKNVFVRRSCWWFDSVSVLVTFAWSAASASDGKEKKQRNYQSSDQADKSQEQNVGSMTAMRGDQRWFIRRQFIVEIMKLD